MQIQKRKVGKDEFAYVSHGSQTMLVYPTNGGYGVFSYSPRAQTYTRLVDRASKLDIAIRYAARRLGCDA